MLTALYRLAGVFHTLALRTNYENNHSIVHYLLQLEGEEMELVADSLQLGRKQGRIQCLKKRGHAT